MPDDASPNSARLAELLASTLLPETDPQQRLAEQTNCLAPIVRRHRGQAMNLRPILVGMVESMLGTLYHAPASRFQASPLAATVAQSLWDDPTAQQRLHRLWQKLCEDLV